MKKTFTLTLRFILFTVIFNIISFSVYFFTQFTFHMDSGEIWLPIALAQVVFTVLVFRVFFNILDDKIYEKQILIQALAIYCIFFSVLSVIMVLLRNDGWYSYIFTNTFYLFNLSVNELDETPYYIIIYFLENILKCVCLYLSSRNIKMKKISKIICITVIILLVTIFMFKIM